MKKALDSVFSQTRRADEVIVVTDSTAQNKESERQLLENSGVTYLEDAFAHNYAGSLNTAIHYILKKNLFLQSDYADIYIAFLDDDDVWRDTYLGKAEQTLHGEDFFVSGLIYRSEEGAKQLSIPQTLSIDSFLRGNPHLQGSNSFVRLDTLLRAGLFDENMSSTTDRDVFTRIMLLKPAYAVLNEYLVEVNAFNDRARITNGAAGKTDGLKKFYYKYSGYMSDETKGAFFDRAQNLFGVSKEEIENIERAQSVDFERKPAAEAYKGRLTIGFIATDYRLGLRLLKQLTSLQRDNTKIVILINFTEDRTPYLAELKASGYRYELIDKNRILMSIEKRGPDPLVTAEKLQGDIIRDIAVARTILQKYLHQCTADGDVVWVLDEDMELNELVLQNGGLRQIPLDIDSVIPLYMGAYDAVVGNYSLDAPLPALSTLRVALLDYVYCKTAKIGKTVTLSDCTDYYYDLSDFGNIHLETPLALKDACTLDDIFSGKAHSRPLYLQSTKVGTVKSRGGNTLIFNRELLMLPNWSIQIGDKIGRRGDYFWVLQAKTAGYKLANVPFATLHDRSKAPFDMAKETKKLLLDLIGSSFTKAIEQVGIDVPKEEFHRVYKEYFTKRLVKFTASYFRIRGLLSIVNDDKYSVLFTDGRLRAFMKEAAAYLDFNKVTVSFESFRRKLQIRAQMTHSDEMKAKIEELFSVSKGKLRLLGSGGEGAVFTDDRYVYKYFYKPLVNEAFFKKIARNFHECDALYPLEFFKADGTDIIRYPYEKSCPYRGGHARQLAEFLRFAKENGFVFDNYKQCNFIVVDGKLKLIDYGKSFLPFDERKHDKSVVRVYEMLRYPFLTEEDFKQLIQLYYQGTSRYLDDGCDLFRQVVNKRYKEDLHDGKVLQLAEGYRPVKILDYGAGKCKIANTLSERFDVSVFDIDLDTVTKRARPSVCIFERAEDIPRHEYDLVISNLVLCCVDNNVAEEVVRNISFALSHQGRAIISICNPFFNSVQNTELRTTALKGNYHCAEVFWKCSAETGKNRLEFHRPVEYYQNLFGKYGLVIEQIVEGDGANLDTLMPISEHIIFDCKKIADPRVFDDLSLLIKTNPMEHRSIYRNINHIVGTLERGGRFVRKVVVADLTHVSERARRYERDDVLALRSELERAKKNGSIDEIVYAEQDEENIKALYGKYFDVESVEGHSANGQGLYATLCGFEAVKTNCVFQTDSDILYHNADAERFLKGMDFLRKGAIAVSLSIAKEAAAPPVYGCRTEVRSCFLALDKLRALLPLGNEVKDGMVQLPWHRALDKKLQGQESVRLSDKDVWFVHPENCKKREANLIAYAESRIANDRLPKLQYGQVDLIGDKAAWTKTTNADVVIYIRGYNTPPERLKRMFAGLKNQTYQDFSIVYVDDASQNESAAYAEYVLRYDRYFKNKTVALFNDTNVGEIENLVFVMNHVIVNPEAVVINLDNDDYFVNDHAVEKIIAEFQRGAEVTCGNCIRYDKPLKNYMVYSFERVWERDGDNIWLHPKCFKRKLFDCIDVEKDLRIDGKFVEVNTDFAMMLPMIAKSKKNVFIEDILYYFEPSMENRSHRGKYDASHKKEIKEILLKRAKERADESRKNKI